MERLTKHWEKNGSHYHCLVACEESCINNGHTSCYCDPIMEVRLKLAAYEDTGLTPEEVNACTALREQQEREKGCEYCLEVDSTNDAGREFYKPLPAGSIANQGEMCLAHDKDGWSIHYEDCDDTGVMCNITINRCPICGRKLGENNG